MTAAIKQKKTRNKAPRIWLHFFLIFGSVLWLKWTP